MRDADPQQSTTRRDPVASARRVGLDAAKAAAGRLTFQSEAPCQWQLQAAVQTPRPFQKGMRLFDFQPGPLPQLPAWIGADVSSVMLWRWEFANAMRGYGNLYDESNEPGPDGEGLFDDMLDGLRDDPEGVQVDLRAEVFDSMGAEVVEIDEDRPAAQGHPAVNGRWLYSMATADEPKIAKALTRFYKDDKRVQHERHGAFDVWTIGEGASLFVEGESESMVSVRALAVGEGQLLFSADVDLLTEALDQRTQGPRLVDDSAWMALVELLRKWDQPRTAVRALFRLDRTLENGYPLAPASDAEENDALVTNLWQLLLFGTAKSAGDLPYSALPGYEKLRHAFPRTALTLSQSDGGWTIRLGALSTEADSK